MLPLIGGADNINLVNAQTENPDTEQTILAVRLLQNGRFYLIRYRKIMIFAVQDKIVEFCSRFLFVDMV